MFEANSQAVKYHLRDLDRQFQPRITDHKPETAAPRVYPVATLLAFAVVALTLGTAFMA